MEHLKFGYKVLAYRKYMFKKCKKCKKLKLKLKLRKPKKRMSNDELEKFNEKLNEIREKGNINNKPISCYDEETGKISYFDTVEEMVDSW